MSGRVGHRGLLLQNRVSPVDVKFLLHGQGADGGTTFTDSSVYGRTVGIVSGPTTSNLQVKYGTTSIKLPGTGYLTIPDDSSIEPGTQKFTLELWLWLVSGTDVAIINKGPWPAGNSTVLIYVGGGGELTLYASSTGSSWDVASNVQFAGSLTTGQWNHVCVERDAANLSAYFNGTRSNFVAVSPSVSLLDSALDWQIGAGDGGGKRPNAYVMDVRYVLGKNAYGGAFTPPAGMLADPT